MAQVKTAANGSSFVKKSFVSEGYVLPISEALIAHAPILIQRLLQIKVLPVMLAEMLAENAGRLLAGNAQFAYSFAAHFLQMPDEKGCNPADLEVWKKRYQRIIIMLNEADLLKKIGTVMSKRGYATNVYAAGGVLRAAIEAANSARKASLESAENDDELFAALPSASSTSLSMSAEEAEARVLAILDECGASLYDAMLLCNNDNSFSAASNGERKDACKNQFGLSEALANELIYTCALLYKKWGSNNKPARPSFTPPPRAAGGVAASSAQRAYTARNSEDEFAARSTAQHTSQKGPPGGLKSSEKLAS